MKQAFLQQVNDYIEQQLALLLAPYEEKNALLQKQNADLQLEIAELKNQLQQLQTKTQLPAHVEELVIPKDRILWFTAYLKALEQHDERFLALLAPHFKKQVTGVNQINKTAFPNFLNYLCKLLKKTTNEQTAKAILTIFLHTARNSKGEQVRLKLLDSPALLSKLTANEQLCLLKFKVFIALKMSDSCAAYIRFLLDEHATTIENLYTTEQFSQLFWYAYLFDMEQQFLKTFSHKQQWLKDKNPLTMLYFKARDLKQTAAQLAPHKKALTDANILSADDLITIYKKLDVPIIANSVRSQSAVVAANNMLAHFTKNNFYIIRDADMPRFVSEFHLKPGTILLTLYEGNTNLNGKPVKIKALVNRQKTAAYITEQDFDDYKKALLPLKLHASKFYYHFVWPTTTIAAETKIETKTNDAQETLTLREKSELKALGYHYTLQQNVRWDMLKKAVKQLGLQSVAYTLASNAKRLKGRKPDSPAIAVWESDLQRLKQTFYQKNFLWPTV